jgi:Uncharacterized conserved domain (SAYSvFN)
MNRMINAGPMVVILTALVLIFTIGLGDGGDGTHRTGPSAYSVFNRGFERLLGSIDSEALLAQHLGGGAAGGMMMMMGRNDGDNLPQNGNADEGRPARPRLPVAGARQQQRQERGDNVPLVANRNLGHQNRDAAGHDDDNGGDDDGPERNGDDNRNNNNNNNRARKSGKKQRREIRRQREEGTAATQRMMGMGMDPEEDTIAVQLLIEAQIAAENNHNGDARVVGDPNAGML